MYLILTAANIKINAVNIFLFAQIKVISSEREFMNYNYDMLYFVKKNAPDTWVLKDLLLPFCDLTFILEGSAVYTSKGCSYSLAAGDAIFLPAGNDRYAQTDGMLCAAFNFHSDAPPFSEVTRITWRNDPVLNGYFNDFNQAWNTKTDIDRMRCDGLFLLILSRLLELQQSKQSNPYVLQIKDYLHKHYTQKVTVQMVADHVKLNPVYCGALFSKETGETILNYTNTLRIIKAKELLLCTNDSISQIASDVGIEDLYYFSRVFKKSVGISPQQYRTGLFSRT